MEARHDDLGCLVPEQWSVWDSNSNDGDEFLDLEHHPGNSGNANPGPSLPVPHEWPQDDVSAPECWPPDPDLNCFGLDFSVYQPLDYVDETDPPEIHPRPIMGAPSPPSLDAAAWTLSSGESAFTGSSTTAETECLSPYLLTQSPQVYSTAAHVLVDVPQFSTPQTDCTISSGDDIKDAAIASTPGDLRWPLPSQPTGAPNTQHDGGSRPAGLPAREWRKQTKPEACDLCGKGHAFQADLKKHMAAHHPDQARALGISTARHACRWCRRDYARADHLMRHLTQKHGRAPKRRRVQRAMDILSLERVQHPR